MWLGNEDIRNWELGGNGSNGSNSGIGRIGFLAKGQ